MAIGPERADARAGDRADALPAQAGRRPDAGRGVYGISVAAELTGLGVQMLRQYESRGLLDPERTGGGTRRYSDDDLARLRRIKELLAGGLNLAGVGMVLDLEDDKAQLTDDNQRLERENARLRTPEET